MLRVTLYSVEKYHFIGASFGFARLWLNAFLPIIKVRWTPPAYLENFIVRPVEFFITGGIANEKSLHLV